MKMSNVHLVEEILKPENEKILNELFRFCREEMKKEIDKAFLEHILGECVTPLKPDLSDESKNRLNEYFNIGVKKND